MYQPFLLWFILYMFLTTGQGVVRAKEMYRPLEFQPFPSRLYSRHLEAKNSVLSLLLGLSKTSFLSLSF